MTTLQIADLTKYITDAKDARPVKIWLDAFGVDAADPKLFSIHDKTVVLNVDLEGLSKKYPSKASFGMSPLMWEAARLCGYSPLNLYRHAASFLPASFTNLFNIAPPERAVLKYPCPFAYTRIVMAGLVGFKMNQHGHTLSESGGYSIRVLFQNTHLIRKLLSDTHTLDIAGGITVDPKAVDGFQMSSFATTYLNSFGDVFLGVFPLQSPQELTQLPSSVRSGNVTVEEAKDALQQRWAESGTTNYKLANAFPVQLGPVTFDIIHFSYHDKMPEPDPNRHVTVVVNRSDLTTRVCYDQNAGFVIFEKAAGDKANIFARVPEPGKFTPVQVRGTPPRPSLLSFQRVRVSGTVPRRIDGVLNPTEATHCRIKGLLDDLGVDTRSEAGYACDASAEQLDSTTPGGATACGSAPLMALTVRGRVLTQ